MPFLQTPDGVTIKRETGTQNKYGILSLSWNIPELVKYVWVSKNGIPLSQERDGEEALEGPATFLVFLQHGAMEDPSLLRACTEADLLCRV